ncbi:hypothetical protein [Natrinema halophilum]|uniref:DUF1102 domain-containing protein n=1 Tax=Natrinema halophilum TaxID=1699371 RepID=A0A7D5H3T8_9EURY|nr:hypothetical protein [Natrinema halophilum]QLG50071.1 hypothetical protein HYG82_15005 [Natrinema halophilum]
MNRTKQLGIVLITVAVVSSAVFGPGAFSSLTADRDANVDVVGDANAFIGLEPSDGPNGEYATTKNGELQLALDESVKKGGGGGINRGAKTGIRDVFTITNQGDQPIGIWLDEVHEDVTFTVKSGHPIERKANAISLKPGQSVSVGLTIDVSEYDESKVIESITVNADSDVSGTPVSELNGREGGTPVNTGSGGDGGSGGSSDSGDSSDSGGDDENCKVLSVGTWGTCKDKGVAYGKGKAKGAGEFAGEQINGGKEYVGGKINGGTEFAGDVVTGGKNGVDNFMDDPGGTIAKHTVFDEDLPTPGSMLRGDLNGNGKAIWEHSPEAIIGRMTMAGPIPGPQNLFMSGGDFQFYTNSIKGAALGSWGNPGYSAYDPTCDPYDPSCVAPNQAASASYQVGHLGGSFIPYYGSARDLLDAEAHYRHGNHAQAGISALGAVPVLGDSARATKKFGKIKKALKGSSKADNAGIVAKNLGKSPANAKTLDQYTNGRATKLTGKHGSDWRNVRDWAAKRGNLKKMEGLKKRGVSEADMRYLLEEDIHGEVAIQLLDKTATKPSNLQRTLKILDNLPDTYNVLDKGKTIEKYRTLEEECGSQEVSEDVEQLCKDLPESQTG